MRRSFACGHRGHGKYCHRCANQGAEHARAEHARAARREDRLRLEATAAIDLSAVRHLPAVRDRALSLLDQLTAGAHPLDLNGKLLASTNGEYISIPIDRDFRILVERTSLKPIRIISHESYNKIGGHKSGRRIC